MASGTENRKPDSIALTMRAPDRVESFRLNPEILPELTLEEPISRLDEWEIIEVGPELHAGEARRVARLLLDSEGYLDALDPRGRKKCEFRLRNALRFTRAGAAPVEVIICFDCSQLRVRTADGAYSWFGNFDPMEKSLARQFRSIDPTLKF